MLTETDIILRFSYLGYPGKFNFSEAAIWLYKNYQIYLEKENDFIKIYFENKLLLIIKSNEDEKVMFNYIIEDVLKLWKCKDGVLSGPSLENFEEPDTEWT